MFNRIRNSALIVLGAIVALTVSARLTPAFGQNKATKLHAPDGIAGDGFGYSVAISGNTAVIGAWCDDNYAGLGIHIPLRWLKLGSGSQIAGIRPRGEGPVRLVGGHFR